MELFNTEVLDIFIEDARSKKKTVDSKMDLVLSLMNEVEWMEKAAEQAKQEVDNCTLYINQEMVNLMFAQQRVKESNEKRAREVNAHRDVLVTEMNKLQFRISGVLNDGDGCVSAIDEMRISLEKRLTSALIKKETADNDKLEKELALEYQKSQMEKLVEESKKLEQEEIENLKLQEFVIDRGHVLNMLQDEISCKCLDVNLLKAELEDYQVENRIVNSQKNDSGLIQERTNSYMDQLDEGKWARIGPKLKHAYQDGEMEERLVEESKILNQHAMENLKLQECLFTKDMFEDSQQERKILATEDCLRPIIQETTPRQDCNCYKCCIFLEWFNNKNVAGGEMETKKIIKSKINDSEMRQDLVDSHTVQLDNVKWARTGPYLNHASQESQMEKFVKGSKRREQEAMVNLKLQELLPIKEMLEDSQEKSETLVFQDYLRPMVQETTLRQDCESYNCDSISEEFRRSVVANKEKLRTEKFHTKSQINALKEIQELENSYMDELEKGRRAKKVAKRREHTRRARPRYIIQRTRR